MLVTGKTCLSTRANLSVSLTLDLQVDSLLQCFPLPFHPPTLPPTLNPFLSSWKQYPRIDHKKTQSQSLGILLSVPGNTTSNTHNPPPLSSTPPLGWTTIYWSPERWCISILVSRAQLVEPSSPTDMMEMLKAWRSACPWRGVRGQRSEASSQAQPLINGTGSIGGEYPLASVHIGRPELHLMGGHTGPMF